MKTLKCITFGILLAVCAIPLQAHEYSGNGIHVDHPWAMPTPPVQPINSAAYLTVKNQRDVDIRLIGVTSPISKNVSIHQTRMENGMMRMEALPDGLVIRAGKPARFKPGGLHIMLRHLDQPLKDGDRFPLELSFEDGTLVKVEVYVERGASNSTDTHNH